MEERPSGAGDRSRHRRQPLSADRPAGGPLSAERGAARLRSRRHVGPRAEYGRRLGALVRRGLRVHRHGRTDPFVPVHSVRGVESIDRQIDRAVRANGPDGNPGPNPRLAHGPARHAPLRRPDRRHDADSSRRKALEAVQGIRHDRKLRELQLVRALRHMDRALCDRRFLSARHAALGRDPQSDLFGRRRQDLSERHRRHATP